MLANISYVVSIDVFNAIIPNSGWDLIFHKLSQLCNNYWECKYINMFIYILLAEAVACICFARDEFTSL